MKTKEITVNGDKLEYHFDDDCRMYWLDEDGNDTQLVDEEDEICYDYAFSANVYVNDMFMGGVTDEIYTNDTPYMGVKHLIRAGFNQAVAIQIYNDIKHAIGYDGWYRAEDFEGDQQDEEWKREWRAEMENNQPPEDFWYNKYKTNQP